MATDVPYLSANGLRVTTLDLSVPYYGLPVADVSLAAGSLLTNPVILRAGNLTMRMAVAKLPDGSPAQTSFAGSTTARLVGGAGAWSTPVSLAPYNNPAGVLVSKVLADLAKATGTSDATRESATLAAGLDRSLGTLWVPETGAPASRILSVLAGALWWVDVGGVTRIASTRASTTVTSAATVEGYSGSAGLVTVATEDPAAWLPGATYTSAVIPAGITVAASRFRSDNGGQLRVEVLVQ